MSQRPVTLTLSAVGFCGKVPREGDFVARGLPPAARREIEAWLSRGLAAARAALGAGFEAAWHAAPLWRFAARPGGLADGFALGVIGPSVDAVGRSYPICIAALARGDADPAAALASAADFLAAAEDAALDALDPEADVAALVAALSPPASVASRAAGASGAPGARPLPLSADGRPLPSAPPCDSAWATIGGADSPPRGFAVAGPPDPAMVFVRLLSPAEAPGDDAGALFDIGGAGL